MMEILSRTYGWTPSEIRNQRSEDIEAYITIINEKAGIEKRKSKK